MRLILTLFAMSAVCAAYMPPAAAQPEDEKIMARAAEFFKAGDTDSAFMSLHALVSAYPGSAHAREALFAMGEYYYRTGNLRDASGAFFRLAKEYPDSPELVFCYAYLLEISRKNGKTDQVRALENALSDSRRMIFIFTDSKEYELSSLSGTRYKAVYQIDKVEVYADGALFTKVSH